MRFGFVSEGEWVARCVLADSSRWSAQRFYMHAFALPLFLPTDVVYLTYGERINRGYWERVDEELVAAVEQQLPKLNQIATLDGLVEHAADWSINIRDAELRLSVAAIWRNEEMVEEVRAVLKTRSEPEYDWVREVEERCANLLHTIDSQGFGRAVEVLASRRSGVLALLD
jgi:hypothetical protein